MKKWSFLALLLIGATVLGATVLREPIASAAQSTATTIVGPLDTNGNVMVHEQGTVNVRDIDEAARQPFHLNRNFLMVGAAMGHSENLTPEIPPGKHFVVEYFSARVTAPAGQRLVLLDLVGMVNVNNGAEADLTVPLSFQGSADAQDYYSASEQVLLHAGHEGHLAVVANRGDGEGSLGVRVYVSGYLVDIP